MIQPTPGRIVWFTPYKGDADIAHHDKSQPLAAIVVYAWGERYVNLTVFDQNGATHARTSVLLLQDDDPAPDIGLYAQWMPYQKGQAAKADAKE